MAAVGQVVVQIPHAAQVSIECAIAPSTRVSAPVGQESTHSVQPVFVEQKVRSIAGAAMYWGIFSANKRRLETSSGQCNFAFSGPAPENALCRAIAPAPRIRRSTSRGR
jgi:hypothetical protein